MHGSALLQRQIHTIRHAVIPTAISSAYAGGSSGEHAERYFRENGKAHVIAADCTTQLAIDKVGPDPDCFRIPEMRYPVGNRFPVFGQNLGFPGILRGTADYYRDHPAKLIFHLPAFLVRSLVPSVPVWIRSLDMPESIKVSKALDDYGPRTETTQIHSATASKEHLINADKSALEYRSEQKPGRILSNAAREPQTAEFGLSKTEEEPGRWTLLNAEVVEMWPKQQGKLASAVPTHDFRPVVGTREP